MSAKIIDGNAIGKAVREELRAEVADMKSRGIVPGLTVVLVGEDAASQVYVRMKGKAADELGMKSDTIRLPPDTAEADLLALVDRLNADPAVHGILALMPMAGGIDQKKVFNAITPVKDLDCVNPANIGHVLLGDQLFAPATPSACIEILDREGVDLKGLDVTLVGRSNIVGKPLALLCLGRNATVRFVHTYCRDVPAACREADVLISAAPVQNMIKADMVKPGAVVIDVTTIRVDGRQVGSLEFEAVCQVAGRVTPVPGGVGPVTNVMLLKNALVACKAQTGVA